MAIRRTPHGPLPDVLEAGRPGEGPPRPTIGIGHVRAGRRRAQLRAMGEAAAVSQCARWYQNGIQTLPKVRPELRCFQLFGLSKPIGESRRADSNRPPAHYE